MDEYDDISDIISGILDGKEPEAPKPAEKKPITQVESKADDVFDFELDDMPVITKPAPRDDDYGNDPTEDARLTAAMPAGPVEVAVDTSVNISDDELKEFTAEISDHVFSDTEERTDGVRIPVPTFTTEELLDTFDIRKFASLVVLNTNRWHAKVKDRQASKDAAKVNDADDAAFETRKKLLVGADEKLIRIHKAIDAARLRHYELTLPWSATGLEDAGRRTGARVLPNTLFFEYTQEMAKFRKEMEAALGDFVPAYPQLIQQAKQKLGKRFDPREYPNPSSIAAHFNLSFDFQPIPKGDDFKGLPQQQLNALAKHLNNSTQKMLENALQENWVRMRTAVANMAERLADPKNRFHYTLVENVREVVKLAKHLNLTGDKRMEDVRLFVEKHLCAHDAQELREKPTLRATVAAHAADALELMDKAK